MREEKINATRMVLVRAGLYDMALMVRGRYLCIYIVMMTDGVGNQERNIQSCYSFVQEVEVILHVERGI